MPNKSDDNGYIPEIMGLYQEGASSYIKDRAIVAMDRRRSSVEMTELNGRLSPVKVMDVGTAVRGLGAKRCNGLSVLGWDCVPVGEVDVRGGAGLSQNVWERA